MDEKRYIGEQVRRMRQDRDLTLRELAERSKLSINGVHLIETGQREPSSTSVAKLARGLGVEPGALFMPTPPKAPPPTTMEELLTRAHVENNYLAMSQEEIKAFFDSLTYQEARVVAREVVDARRTVKEYLAAYEGTPEYDRLTSRSFLAYLTAITYVLAEAEKVGDTELQKE